MALIHAEAEAVIEAEPASIYGVISDYRRAHPQILPEEYFSNLVIEQGGDGAGTVFRVTVRVLGTERGYHMRVSEPEPGRALVETDIDSALVTKFTVTPVENGQRARVKIATDWQSSPGLSGIMERLFTPSIMQRIYRQELRQLAAYVQKAQSSAEDAAAEKP